MQTIVPHLWYDKEAKEAAKFYTSIFPESNITNVTVLKDTPSGDCDVISFTVMGYELMAISAGPYFTFNPSISLMINLDPSRDNNARKRIDDIWTKLIDGGKALMEIGAYPFSERYGWVQDKYGLTWQLILTQPEGEERPPVIPSLMFTGDRTGKAGEAIDYYVSIFKNSKRGMTAHYPEGAAPEKDTKIMFAEFMLEGQWFTAMDSGHMHKFGFNEAFSLMISCDTQKEIDDYWKKLSAVPEAEQCGWLKDKYGVSWQVTPRAMNEMMRGDPEKVARLTQAFLPMKKLDLAALQKAYDGA